MKKVPRETGQRRCAQLTQSKSVPFRLPPAHVDVLPLLPFSLSTNQFTTFPNGVLAITLSTSKRTCLIPTDHQLTGEITGTAIVARRVLKLIKQRLTSAAAMVVSSAFVSYAGATSTISAETICSPSKPRKIVRSSRVDQPPVSGVPVAGANAGSSESICIRPKPKTRRANAANEPNQKC